MTINNDEYNYHTCPLHDEIHEGNLHNVEKLLEEGVNIHEIDDWVSTPLEHAVELGNLEIVKALVKRGASPLFGVGVSPLEIAVQTSRIDIISVLLDTGVDINWKLEGNRTLLMEAVDSSNLDIVKFIIEKGADVNAIDDDDFTALMCAAVSGEEEIFNYLRLLSSSDIIEPALKKLPKGLIYRKRLEDTFTEDFIFAAMAGQIDTIVEGIKLGVDVNAISSQGNIALCSAAERRQLEIIQILLKNGADVDIKSESEGTTALMEASRFGHVEIVELLVNSGADINATDDYQGRTALMIAIDRPWREGFKGFKRQIASEYFKHREIVQLLIENGADVNAQDKKGYTALKLALSQKKYEMAKLLFDAGAKN